VRPPEILEGVVARASVSDLRQTSSSSSVVSAPNVDVVHYPPEREQMGKKNFPHEKEASSELLKVIFEGKRTMRAQDFYARTHQLGLPSGRSSALKWLDRIHLQGLIQYGPAVDGRGRMFTVL